MTETIRVLIADDQQLVRGALAALLNIETDLDVVAEVGNGNEVLAAVLETQAHVALLDIEMPGMTGIEAAAQLRERAPAVRSLIVTTFGRPGFLQRALAAGASGFIVKDTPPTQLTEAIRRVARGLRVIDPALAEESLFAGRNPLTERETEVCRAALQYESLRDIARAVHLSTGTVRNHFSAIIGKTGASNRHSAVHMAEEQGWL